MLRCIAKVALALGLAALSAMALAQFPSKPVRLIVPYPPGQATDIAARLLAEALTKEWGRQVIVDNKAGGAGIPGMVASKDATPDGHSLILGTSAAMVVNPAIFSKLPYDPIDDFILVTGLFKNPLLIVANSATPYNNLKDIVDGAKKAPATINWGYPGTGNTQHLTGELFKFIAGVDIVAVLYKGSGQMISDLLGNQIPLAVDSVSTALPHIKSGKLRAIAMTGAQRASQLPEVPTVAELGYPGFAGEGWGGIIAPKGTRPELVAKIGADISKVRRDTAMLAKFNEMGLMPYHAGQQEWLQLVKIDLKKWAEVARRANVKVE